MGSFRYDCHKAGIDEKSREYRANGNHPALPGNRNNIPVTDRSGCHNPPPDRIKHVLYIRVASMLKHPKKAGTDAQAYCRNNHKKHYTTFHNY
jgi:hypothetical protein